LEHKFYHKQIIEGKNYHAVNNIGIVKLTRDFVSTVDNPALQCISVKMTRKALGEIGMGFYLVRGVGGVF
jgi:hypothetical protein